MVRSFRFWLRWCFPGPGWDILTRGPEAAPEVTPESPDFGQSGVSGVGRPESPVLLVKNWPGSVRRAVRRLVRRLAGVSGVDRSLRSDFSTMVRKRFVEGVVYK